MMNLPIIIFFIRISFVRNLSSANCNKELFISMISFSVTPIYFGLNACLSFRLFVSMYVTNFFLLKLPWNHPLTPEDDP